MPTVFHRLKSAFILVTVTTMSATTAQAATAIKVNVNGMVCAFCAQGIEKRLMKLPASKEVFVDLKKRVVAIEAKDGQTLDPKQVAAEIVDAGYDVTKIESVAQSVSDIRAETKSKK